MEALWSHGALSVREIQEAFPEADRPAYTTVQTMVYRLEGKQAIRRVKKMVYEKKIALISYAEFISGKK